MQQGENPAIAALQATNVPFTLAEPVSGARDLPEFARRSGLRERQVVKSLLLDLDGTGFALLLVAGDRNADYAALRRRFGLRSVRMADREAVLRITGYPVGRVTPLALRTPGLLVLVDEVLLSEGSVSLGTGVPGRHVRLAGRDLPRAVNGEPGPFAK
ncbi:MAG TPA: YbaK/EbsC family protein [Dehalococcoidia bacterium]|jgi:Cys-tRNA(Pro)/Cys-tRNA(Cys) deacylase|nr:YbaK/EbsC family protein [Dehalococcoidia bacterium]